MFAANVPWKFSAAHCKMSCNPNLQILLQNALKLECSEGQSRDCSSGGSASFFFLLAAIIKQARRTSANADRSLSHHQSHHKTKDGIGWPRCIS